MRGHCTRRYIVYSYRYEQKDGRVSYPLIFIYYSPNGPGAGAGSSAGVPVASALT